MKNKYKNIFIFAYYSFRDPVFQSAVLPYFQNLATGTNLRFILLTFEQSQYKINKEEARLVEAQLLKQNIIWYQSTWHSGSFKLIKKIFDFIWGILLAGFLILKYKAQAIYSEAFPGAIISYHLSQVFRLPHLIHSFEPHTEYMVEAGVWKNDSWEAVLLKKYERKIAMKADYIFTATQQMITRLKMLGSKANIIRVPSCVDANVFIYSEIDRFKIRSALQVLESECVITYLGKFGGMYMDDEIFDFFTACERFTEIKFKYFILTPDPHNNIWNQLETRNLNKQKFTVKTLRREEVSAYLSASDFGFVPVRQNPSKRFCSPIKDGEYWACGLPIIIPEGISDDYILAQENRIGIIMKDTSDESFENVLIQINKWLHTQDRHKVVERCRSFALADRGIEKYKEIYRQIFNVV